MKPLNGNNGKEFILAAFGIEQHESGDSNEERGVTIDKNALFEITKALWPAIVRVACSRHRRINPSTAGLLLSK